MKFVPTVGGHVNGEREFWIERWDAEDRWAVRWRGVFVEAFVDLANAMDAAERFDAEWPTEPNVALAAANYRP